MSKNMEEKVEKLVKSLFDKVKKQNAIKDVLDQNRFAEMSPDSIPSTKSGILNKAKIDEDKSDKQKRQMRSERGNKSIKTKSGGFEDRQPKEKFSDWQKKQVKGVHSSTGADMKHDNIDVKQEHKEKLQDLKNMPKPNLPKSEKINKTEELVKNIIDSFKKISDIYLEKKEKMEKAIVDQGLSPEAKKQARSQRKTGFQPKTRSTPESETRRKLVSEPRSRAHYQSSLENKIKDRPKKPSQQDLEYPMAASEKRCWEGYEPTPGKKPYSEGSCQPIKKEEKEKPFHGYNPEKHSKEGGLSAKAREKYNKETGSNLQAPVSSKEAKKSPKKAARRKSFCARMSGVKGETSKDGKLTPKGAALKRWDCSNKSEE